MAQINYLLDDGRLYVDLNDLLGALAEGVLQTADISGSTALRALRIALERNATAVRPSLEQRAANLWKAY